MTEAATPNRDKRGRFLPGHKLPGPGAPTIEEANTRYWRQVAQWEARLEEYRARAQEAAEDARAGDGTLLKMPGPGRPPRYVGYVWYNLPRRRT